MPCHTDIRQSPAGQGAQAPCAVREARRHDVRCVAIRAREQVGDHGAEDRHLNARL